jgi:hypothetical protein
LVFSGSSERTYFGGGVVVPLEFFFDFLPPLWAVLLVLVEAFFPDAVDVVAGLSVEPPVAWAKDRPAPSSSVNAIVSSFFIQSPSEGYQVLESFNSVKNCLRNILSREAEKRKAFF